MRRRTIGIGVLFAILTVTLLAQEPQVINRSLTVRNNILAGGSIKTAGVATGAGIGYSAGAGGAVTQLTDRATGVAVTGYSGAITTINTSLAAEASAVFVVTNPLVQIGDVVVVSQRSGAVALNTDVVVSAVTNGTFSLTVINGNAAGGTAETGAIVINFAIIKAVSS